MWSCPHCREALQLDPESGRTLACTGGHRFDLAREGYVNLLPANRKRSQEPGDSKDMIAARRRIHQANLYLPLVEAIQQRLQPLQDELNTVLDLGCGEGYYSKALHAVLPTAQLHGIDISKPAVRLAARYCSEGEFAVASAFDVPMADSSVDLVLSVFAPASADELRRLVRSGGYFLKVTPGRQHLWELRERLYDEPTPHESETALLVGVEEIAAQSVDYQLTVDAETVKDLVAMTPYAHRGNRERLSESESLELQMAFKLSLQRVGAR